VSRFYCPVCQKAFTRLPAFLLPGKRYTAAEIEAVLRHLLAGHPLSQAPGEADESTLRRWLKEYRAKIQAWSGQLEAILWQLQQRLRRLTGLAVDPLQRLQSVLLEYPELPSHWTLLVKALYWLQKSHPRCLG